MAESSKEILNEILSNVDPDYDISEGSFFYDINAPISIKLSSAYSLVDKIIIRRNVATSTGDDLTEVCSEMGVDRYLATYATGSVLVRGVSGSPINIGDLVASDLVMFEFIESTTIPESGSCVVKVRSKVIGSAGNVPTNSIKSFPKTLQGLQEVTNLQATTGGYDEETDESLKERYYLQVRTPGTSGNKNDYINWAREVQNVGAVRVKPLWNGRGTVKVIIVDSNKRGATQTLIDETYNHIDSVRPICSGTLTVVSAVEKSINVTANIKLSVNTNLGTIQTEITNLINEYLKSIAFNSNYVSIAKIGNIILEAGALDYTDLKINGGTSNITLTDEEIAVMRVVTLGVV